MREYFLDTNVVIGLWKQYPFIIDKLIEDKEIKILKEIGEELAVKETKKYRRQQVLSERLCNLLPFVIEVDKNKIEDFYSIIEIKYSKNGNAYFDETNKLSENDLLLLYLCNSKGNSILVTEDKYLFNAARHILGDDRVLTLMELVESRLNKS